MSQAGTGTAREARPASKATMDEMNEVDSRSETPNTQIAIRALPFAALVALMFFTIGSQYGTTPIRAGILLVELGLAIASVTAWIPRNSRQKDPE